MPFNFLPPKDFKIIWLSNIWLWQYLLNVIPKTRRGHDIRYLHYYQQGEQVRDVILIRLLYRIYLLFAQKGEIYVMDINISVCLVKEKCHYDRLYLFVYKNIQLSIDSKFSVLLYIHFVLCHHCVRCWYCCYTEGSGSLLSVRKKNTF